MRLGDGGLETLQREAYDADALLVCWASVPKEAMMWLPRCRVLSLYTAGYNNVDLAAAGQAGIAVSNNPDYCAQDVAVHALALLLAGHRKLLPLTFAIRSGNWDPLPFMRPAPALRRQTVGILGFGRAGQHLAELLRGLAGRVLVHNRKSQPMPPGVKAVSFRELLAQSDYLSIHVPLAPETHHLLGKDALSSMKPTAFLINTSRGLIVDESALVAALQAQQLGGAALDVFSVEPLPMNHPLRGLPNVIITPHVAWYSEESGVPAARQGGPDHRPVLQRRARTIAERAPLATATRNPIGSRRRVATRINCPLTCYPKFETWPPVDVERR